MATMGFRLLYGDPEIRYIAEADTQTFVAGDLVYLNAGQVTVAADDATIFGVAQCTSAADTNNVAVPVSVINPSQTWLAEFDDAQTAAYIGEDYGCNVSTGDMSVNLGETTNTTVTLIDLDPRDGVTTASGGRVLVKFLPGVLQTMKGSGTAGLYQST